MKRKPDYLKESKEARKARLKETQGIALRSKTFSKGKKTGSKVRNKKIEEE